MKRKHILKIRKTHRYLGIFLGIQFIFWTISGLYFSWTNLDEIHGDHLRNLNYKSPSFQNLISPSTLSVPTDINSIEIRNIDSIPYYYINNNQLFNAYNGAKKDAITKQEAEAIAAVQMKPEFEVEQIELIESTNGHHEYREKLLPAYVISYKSDNSLKAYVSAKDGKFQTVRHRDWRIFDFLWMTHTMDYETRDDINNTTLRIFSLLGLITVLSGFTLYFVTSPTFNRLFRKKKK